LVEKYVVKFYKLACEKEIEANARGVDFQHLYNPG